MQGTTEQAVANKVIVIEGHDLAPGNNWAWLIGCTCSPSINRHGLGMYTDQQGDRKFWISSDCPLHGKKETNNV
jgi:hypothetical protein